MVEETRHGPVLRVYVTPRARTDAVIGADARGLLVRVRAAPEKGKANDDVERTVAKWLGLAASKVSVVSGQTTRVKRLRVDIDAGGCARSWPNVSDAAATGFWSSPHDRPQRSDAGIVYRSSHPRSNPPLMGPRGARRRSDPHRMATANLPTGTVTFLMTDVEGSTPLWEADREAMGAAMARHDEVIEREVAAAGGVVVRPRGEGDSRFCVFATAPAAVAAALAIQRTLAGERWQTTEPIRVRIAIHTGHADMRDGDYYGTSPNRCARLRDLGHGGQILISAAAAGLVASELPDKAELIALGSYRLRGIELPEPVHQLAHPDLPHEFPALRGGAPGNLPEPLTSFIGRAREIQDLGAMLDSQRLLTLTGAAGVGKTRLAIEVARSVSPRFPDGAWLCELAPVREPATVSRSLIGVFGLSEERERSVEQILSDYVRGKRLLMVLDNCEHLLDACANLCAHLLKVSLGCSILVTSREPLGAQGEATRRVPSLALPQTENAPLADLAACESVALFCERARACEPDFVLDERTAPAVAQICRRLDGIPLAIELAAGKLAVLDPVEIARRVEDRFALLTGGPRTALERQQTMRAAVDWSYSLLSEDERAVLRRLGVFVGGFTMDAARDVCATVSADVDDLIASLVRKSLVAKDSDQPGRYLLLETIRAYAAEKLADDGQAPDARGAHLGHFCALVAQAADPLEGGPDQQTWLERLEADHENIQAAVSFATSADPDAGLRLAADVQYYWDIRGHWGLGRRAMELLLAASDDRATIERARALRAAGRWASFQGDYETARAGFEESLAIARELGDRRQIGRAVGSLGTIAHRQGDYETARARYEESLAIARELGDRRQIASVVGNLGEDARIMRGDYEAARARYEESLAIARDLGDRRQIAAIVGFLGQIAHGHGDYEAARAGYEESLAIARELGDRIQIALWVGNLGEIARVRGDDEAARARYSESLAIAREIGYRELMAQVVAGLGEIACDQGDDETARARFAESLAIARELGRPPITAGTLRGCARLAEVARDYDAACALAAGADAARERIGFPLDPFEQARFDETLVRLREAMVSDAFDAAWARGRAMSLEEAVDLALTV